MVDMIQLTELLTTRSRMWNIRKTVLLVMKIYVISWSQTHRNPIQCLRVHIPPKSTGFRTTHNVEFHSMEFELFISILVDYFRNYFDYILSGLLILDNSLFMLAYRTFIT